MDQAFIDGLSAADLQQCASCEQIIGVESYIKTDADGNSVNVTEEEAQEAAGAYSVTLPPHVRDESDWGYTPDGGTFRDTYMKLVYIIYYLGNGRYKFSVDATWLMGPFCTFRDSLGACMQNFTIVNSTRSGWYSYTMDVYTGASTITSEHKVDQTEFQNVRQGNWYGSALIVDLMDDNCYRDPSNGQLIGASYYDHKMHYEFEGIIHQPGVETYFDTTATYSHLLIAVTSNTSVGLSSSGPCVGIGISLDHQSELRYVELESPVHYLPD